MRIPQGQGVWIHYIQNFGPQVIVNRCRTHGIGHLVVKFADGRQWHPRGGTSYHPRIRELLPLAHAAGIEVWGWPYIYGQAPAEEAQVEAAWFRELGLDGFVIDAEAEYKGRPDAARAYVQTLRTELPNATIALSSYMWPSYHSDFPWREFMRHCDLAMPQVYWWGRYPVPTLARACVEWEKFGRPLVATGAACNSAQHAITSEQMEAFAANAPALGCQGVNWWYWDGAQSAHWSAIKRIGAGMEPALDLAVVDPDGQVIDCHPEETDDHVRADVRPLVEALGYEAHWRVREDGRRRVYVKPPERHRQDAEDGVADGDEDGCYEIAETETEAEADEIAAELTEETAEE